MDEGLPIAYQVLERDVPVYASGSALVGTVDHVVAAPEEDIFHGIVVSTTSGQRFIAADQIVALHEHGVDLEIDEDAVARLPAPHGGAPTYHDVEPGIAPTKWHHFLDTMTGRTGGERFKQDR